MTNQILRIPTKYSELINTLSNEDSGKLFKALFSKNNDNLQGIVLTYYNLINTDISNIQKQVDIGISNGWKGKKHGIKGGKPKITLWGDPLGGVVGGPPKYSIDKNSIDNNKEDKYKPFVM